MSGDIIKRLALFLTVSLAAAAAPAAHADPTLFWSDYGLSAIGTVPAGGGAGQNFTGANAYGTTVDPSRDRLFWIDHGSTPFKVYRGDFSNPVATKVQIGTGAAGTAFPFGLAYNPVNDTLYWADGGSKHIKYLKADGSQATGATLLTLASGSVQSPALDPANNKIYWSNNASGKFGVANLDGTGTPGEITLSGSCTVNTPANGQSIAVDPEAGRIYVSYSRSNGGGGERASVADLDGSNCREISSTNAWFIGFTSTSTTLFGAGYSTGDIRTWPLPSVAGAPAALSTTGVSYSQPAYPTIVDVPSGQAAATASKTAAPATLTCQADWSYGKPGMQQYRSPSSSTSYTWSRDGVTIGGATSSTLNADSGGDYSCTVTASNFAGTSSASSSSVALSSPPAPSPEPGPTPEPGPNPGPTPGPAAIEVRTPLAVGTTIRTLVRVPGAGRILQTGTFRQRGKLRGACSAAPRIVNAEGVYRVRCPLTAAARSARKRGSVRVTLLTTYQPENGTPSVSARTVVLRSLKPRFTG